jgi:hypothetical protein
MFSTVTAQDLMPNQVPQAVSDAFSQQFSNAKDIEWEKQGSQFEVDFETGWSRDHEAWFSEEGELVYLKEDIRNRDLPEIVQVRIKSDFADYRIDDLYKITEGDQITFEVSLESRRTSDIDLIISNSGEVLRQSYDD